MEEIETFVVEHNSTLRLDLFLAQKNPNYSRSYFQKLIQANLVLVNGEPVKKRTFLHIGDEVEIAYAVTQQTDLIPEDIPLDILYEDQDLIAVNKPAGMVVHPGAGNWHSTFVHALLFHCDVAHQDHLRPGIVHRLDKQTSGILIAAKHETSHRLLVSLFAQRAVQKKYWAICFGHTYHRTIHTQIARDPIKRQQMCVVSTGGKEAITEVIPLQQSAQLSWLDIIPYTGRTHQIRVHLQHIHTPIVGDSVYGDLKKNRLYALDRHLLHAYSLKFQHPITHHMLELHAPMPKVMHSFVERINAASI